MEPSKPPTKAIIGLIAAVLLVVAATGGVIALSGNKGTPTDTTQTTVSPSASASASATDSSSSTTTSGSYKDGTYTASGSYNSPGGRESIAISVTLTGGTITATSATPQATDGEAEEYQQQFILGYQTLVVGKKIDAVSLSRVAGSSLTSIGFNNALSTIKSEAAA